MQDHVLKLLKQLNDELRESISVVIEKRPPFEQQIPQNDSDSGDEESGEDGRITELGMRLCSIRDILSKLNKLAFKIRNSNLRSISLKPLLYREFVSVAGDESGMNQHKDMEATQELRGVGDHLSTESGELNLTEGQTDIFDRYAEFDCRYMTELFESICEVSDVPQNRILFERLTKAITTRRRIIRYWSRHADKLATGTQNFLGPPMGFGGTKLSSQSHVGEEEAPKLHASGKPESVAQTATSYADTELTTAYNEKKRGNIDSTPVISYISTTWNIHGNVVEVPLLPLPANKGSDFISTLTIHRFVLIALCYLQQPTARDKSGKTIYSEIFSRICALTTSVMKRIGCMGGGVSGPNMKHPAAVFETPRQLADHLCTEHTDNLPETQIPDLVELGEASLEDERERCPICLDKDTFIKSRTTHLANHLERVALFALSRGETEESGLSNAAKGAKTAESRGSLSSISLVFTDRGFISMTLAHKYGKRWMNRTTSLRTKENSTSNAPRPPIANQQGMLPPMFQKGSGVLLTPMGGRYLRILNMRYNTVREGWEYQMVYMSKQGRRLYEKGRRFPETDLCQAPSPADNFFFHDFFAGSSSGPSLAEFTARGGSGRS
ncbi:uncharacterized protein K452DRAFT_310959 [Aplosporella prunicola CBS 121167]|uniref:Uncharacterized protein n=1 Tax=Aplosporella prunicola CBS 121167 TaxID=1176127 RepID=A0A6A6B5T9_9PEZI|nr:uncharacterized protein K452DRAFT_310959 [Aplosporella prunicola CBS 121167]KAF2138998.1 hypothetical protein K452DRAFT_310959 [Aplosporella prunicola CBS 121167]